MTDHEPGPLLDRLVAEAVGWGWAGKIGYDCAAAVDRQEFCEVLRRPSQNDADAIAALEAARKRIGGGCFYKIVRWSSGTWWVQFASDGIFGGDADTLPLAACRAILAWKRMGS